MARHPNQPRIDRRVPFVSFLRRGSIKAPLFQREVSPSIHQPAIQETAEPERREWGGRKAGGKAAPQLFFSHLAAEKWVAGQRRFF